jgi:hypothetical protein
MPGGFAGNTILTSREAVFITPPASVAAPYDRASIGARLLIQVNDRAGPSL